MCFAHTYYIMCFILHRSEISLISCKYVLNVNACERDREKEKKEGKNRKITLVCSLKELHVTNAAIFAFAHLMEERKQTVASIDLFHYIRLLLDQHCGLFVPNDNKHGISLANHRQEIEIKAINCKHLLY